MNKYTGRELENLGRLILEHTNSERLENIIGDKNTNENVKKYFKDANDLAESIYNGSYYISSDYIAYNIFDQLFSYTTQEYYKHLQDCKDVILSTLYDLDEWIQDEIKARLDFQLKENEYQFEVVEILSKTVTITAENEYDAESIINDRYEYGEIRLDNIDDWNDVEFNLINKKEF